MNRIDAGLHDQLMQLHTRAEKWRRRGLWISAICVALLSVSVAVFYVASSMAPDAGISKIDIPSTVMEKVQTTVFIPNSSMGGESATEALTAITSQLAGIVRTVLFLGFCLSMVALFFSLATSREPGEIRTKVFLPIVMAVPLMALNFLGDGVEPEGLVQAARSRDFNRVSKLLAEMKIPSSTAEYVLAQISVAQGEPRRNVELVKRVAAQIDRPASELGFTPKGEAVMAIETAAFGEARSLLAKEYRTSAQAGHTLWFGLGIGLSLLVVGLGIFTSVAFGLSGVLRRRFARVSALLKAPSNDEAASHRLQDLREQELSVGAHMRQGIPVVTAPRQSQRRVESPDRPNRSATENLPSADRVAAGGNENAPLSMAVAMATNSTVLGYAAGGSLLGAMAGDAMSSFDNSSSSSSSSSSSFDSSDSSSCSAMSD